MRARYLVLFVLLIYSCKQSNVANKQDVNNYYSTNNIHNETNNTDYDKNKKLNINDILRTKWTYRFLDGVMDKIEFMDESKYTFYQAELDELFKGEYYVKSDTIFLIQEQGEYDSTFKSNSRHRVKKDTLEMIINNKYELGFEQYWNGKTWKNNYFFTLSK